MSRQFTSQPSLQDLIIDRLDKPVPVKGGGTMKDPLDGHEMTTLEMIAYKMTEQAMSGDDIRQFCQAHRLLYLNEYMTAKK